MVLPIAPGETACFRCALSEMPAPGSSPTCDTAGVLNAAVGVVASWQTGEALKLSARFRQGDATTKTETMSMDFGFDEIRVVFNGKAQEVPAPEQRFEVRSTTKSAEEVLEAAEGEVKKLRREYLEVSMEMKGPMPSPPDNPIEELEGKVVILEREGKEVQDERAEPPVLPQDGPGLVLDLPERGDRHSAALCASPRWLSIHASSGPRATPRHRPGPQDRAERHDPEEYPGLLDGARVEEPEAKQRAGRRDEGRPHEAARVVSVVKPERERLILARLGTRVARITLDDQTHPLLRGLR
jgi:hypothetical protein